MKKKKHLRKILEHPNKSKTWAPGELHNAPPNSKSHRFPIPRHIQDMADELHRLKTIFLISNAQMNEIVKTKFNCGFGITLLVHFLNRIHGVGYNPTHNTLIKLKYLIGVLKKREKEFASGRE